MSEEEKLDELVDSLWLTGSDSNELRIRYCYKIGKALLPFIEESYKQGRIDMREDMLLEGWVEPE